MKLTDEAQHAAKRLANYLADPPPWEDLARRWDEEAHVVHEVLASDLKLLLAALPHLEGVTPAAEKLAIAAALKDHEFMVRGGPGAEVFGCRCGVEFEEPGYDGYWEDPLHLHFADVLAAAGVFSEGATPAIDREALEQAIERGAVDADVAKYFKPGDMDKFVNEVLALIEGAS